MEKYFGPEGILASKVQGFESRPGQIEMAQAVFESFLSEHYAHGGGRHRAPAKLGHILSRQCSAARKWSCRPAPKLSRTRFSITTSLSQEIHRLQTKVVCLKGRRNYLCRRRFLEFCYQPTLWGKEEANFLADFRNGRQHRIRETVRKSIGCPTTSGPGTKSVRVRNTASAGSARNFRAVI